MRCLYLIVMLFIALQSEHVLQVLELKVPKQLKNKQELEQMNRTKVQEKPKTCL